MATRSLEITFHRLKYQYMVVCENYSAERFVVFGIRHQSRERSQHREGIWRRVKRQIGVIWTFVLTCLCVSPLYSEDGVIELGEAAFFSGDSAEYSSPGFDDSDWQKIEAGVSWQEAGVGGVGDLGWYRFRVRIPERWKGKNLSFSPGYVGNVAEVFWDGKRIGSKGSLDPLTGLEWLGRCEAYPVDPAGSAPGMHVIAVRVGCFFSEGGLVGAVPAVGLSGDMRRIQLERERESAFWLVGQIFLYAVFGFLGVVLLCAAPKNLSHWFFMGMFCGEFFMQGYRGLLLLTDLPFSLFLWQLATVGYWGGYCGFLLLLVEDFFRGENTRQARILVVSMIVFAGGAAFSVGSVAYLVLSGVLALLNLVCIGWIGWFLFREARNRDGRAVLLLVVWAVLLASYVPEALNYVVPVVSETGRWTPWSSWFGLVLIAVYGVLLAAQLTSYRARARRLAGHVFSAREEERSRIARELHDGVARSVYLAKESLGQRVDEACEGMRSLSRVMDEIREAAYDLHPAQLNGHGLEEACRRYLEALESEEFQGRLKFDVTGFDPVTDRELYRIFQEFASNALRHGNASELVAALYETEGKGHFCLEENGRGFDAGESRGGLGLTSIRERARLLGGTADWEAGRLRGARLIVVWELSGNTGLPSGD